MWLGSGWVGIPLCQRTARAHRLQRHAVHHREQECVLEVAVDHRLNVGAGSEDLDVDRKLDRRLARRALEYFAAEVDQQQLFRGDVRARVGARLDVDRVAPRGAHRYMPAVVEDALPMKEARRDGELTAQSRVGVVELDRCHHWGS